jgi:hypothetical protein
MVFRIPDIKVNVTYTPWENYWTKLKQVLRRKRSGCFLDERTDCLSIWINLYNQLVFVKFINDLFTFGTFIASNDLATRVFFPKANE